MELTIDECTKKMLGVVKYFQEREKNFDSIDGETVLRAAVMLATYKATLGQFVAQLQYEVNISEMIKKNTWTSEFMEAKKSGEKVTDKFAANYADIKIQTLEETLIENTYKLNLIKNLRTDSGDVISTLQSRFNQMKQERMDANQQNMLPKNPLIQG